MNKGLKLRIKKQSSPLLKMHLPCIFPLMNKGLKHCDNLSEKENAHEKDLHFSPDE